MIRHSAKEANVTRGARAVPEDGSYFMNGAPEQNAKLPIVLPGVEC